MCRDKEHGGRLCPSQLNPEKNKAHNAQRRARYNAPKQEKLFSQEDQRIGKANSSTSLSKEFISSLTPEQKKTLRDYTEFGSKTMNKYIYDAEFREGVEKELDVHGSRAMWSPDYETFKKDLKANLDERIKIIDETTSFRFPLPVTVYSGMNISIPEGEDALTHIKSIHKIGSLYSRPSYVSTSTNSAIAASFTVDNGKTPIVYEMITSQGAPIRKLSWLPVEDEVLLPRDKKFRIVQIKEAVTFDNVTVDDEGAIAKVRGRGKKEIIVIQIVEEE